MAKFEVKQTAVSQVLANYRDFLDARRKLMAAMIRRYYEAL